MDALQTEFAGARDQDRLAPVALRRKRGLNTVALGA